MTKIKYLMIKRAQFIRTRHAVLLEFLDVLDLLEATKKIFE